MAVPGFLLRKLYKRGTLRETAANRFAFSIHNPLAKATLVSPPTFVINGVHHTADSIESSVPDLAGISEENPLVFEKGSEIELGFSGRLLRGGNRIHMTVTTLEFDEIDILVEDREAIYCDLPGAVPNEEE